MYNIIEPLDLRVPKHSSAYGSPSRDGRETFRHSNLQPGTSVGKVKVKSQKN